MKYPIIMNGDHAEFEREHANTPPKERPDWPLPSFDARDWAEAFCKRVREGCDPTDEGWLITWFSCALMRGYDEANARKPDPQPTVIKDFPGRRVDYVLKMTGRLPGETSN